MKVIKILLLLLLVGCNSEELPPNTQEEQIVYHDTDVFNCDGVESSDQSTLLLSSITDKRIMLSNGWVEVYKNGYAATNEMTGVEFCMNGLDIIIPDGKLLYSFGTDTPLPGGIVSLLSGSYTNEQFEISEVKSSCLFEKCEDIDIKRIAFLGNSLTSHAPSPSIGWYGSWGMAATSQENDYAHQLLSMIGDGVKYGIYSTGSWERKLTGFDYSVFDELTSQNPDVIVINTGENIDGKNNSKSAIINHLTELKEHLESKTDSKVIFVAPFWGGQLFRDAFYDFSTINQVKLTVINDLIFNVENTAVAEYSHTGVGKHPSDKGMKLIAERIFKHL